MFRSRMVGLFIGLLVLASACSTAQAIISSVSWKPGVADPLSVFTINPANPTTNDMIFFFDPRDHQTYGNLCVAKTTLGEPSILVDPVQHRIDVSFTLLIGGCTAEVDPVSGLQGAFGELPAGLWTFTSQPGVNHTFTVSNSAIPEPGASTLLLGLVVVAGMKRTIASRRA